MDITQDIQPLTAFRNRSVELMKQLKETQRPMVLTVNGRPEVVVQDAAAYQRLLDLAATADAIEGIRQGQSDVQHGKTRSAREALNEFRKRHAIPR